MKAIRQGLMRVSGVSLNGPRTQMWGHTAHTSPPKYDTGPRSGIDTDDPASAGVTESTRRIYLWGNGAALDAGAPPFNPKMPWNAENPYPASLIEVNIKLKAWVPVGPNSGVENYGEGDVIVCERFKSAEHPEGLDALEFSHLLHCEAWGRNGEKFRASQQNAFGPVIGEDEGRSVKHANGVIIPLGPDGGFDVSLRKLITGRAQVDIAVFYVAHWLGEQVVEDFDRAIAVLAAARKALAA